MLCSALLTYCSTVLKYEHGGVKAKRNTLKSSDLNVFIRHEHIIYVASTVKP
jgi:hypothetical protein